MSRRRYALGGIAAVIAVALLWMFFGPSSCVEEPPSGRSSATERDAAVDADRAPASTEDGADAASGDTTAPRRDAGGREDAKAARDEGTEPKESPETGSGTTQTDTSVAPNDTGGSASTRSHAEPDTGSRTAAANDTNSGASTALADIAPEEMNADQVARRVQRFYDETGDFEAKFRQVYTDVAAGETKTHHGKVFFKKPGKMRWDYYEGAGLGKRTKTLVSDGTELWVYELEFDQAIKKCLKSSQLPTSLTFLMGKGNLLREFDVSFSGEAPSGKWRLELKPKTATSKYTKLRLQVDRESFQVTKTTVFDPYGNTNAISFQNVQLNSGLPASGFQFTPPDDARILQRQKNCQ